MTDMILGKAGIWLTICGNDGSLGGLCKGDKPLLLAAEKAFSLRLLDFRRDYRWFDNSDFQKFELQRDDDGSIVRIWSVCPDLPGMKVISRVWFDGVNFRFRNAVKNIPGDYEFEMIDCPVVTVSESNELFWPKTDGVLLDQPEKSERMFQQLEAPTGLGYGFYPGPCQMQFMASYSVKGGGVYFAADDRSHTTKALEFCKETEGDPSRIRLRIECYCGHDGDRGNYEVPFDLILRPLDGDWQDACVIYRDWVAFDPSLDDLAAPPRWLRKSPVVVILTVRGNGNINSEENQFSDYEKAFPCLKELADDFDSPILALLMRWDQHGPWLPPYCWPPSGSLESFLHLRDLLHRSGNYFGVYCSGTSFTVKSLMNDYSCEAEFKEKCLAKYMASGPRGETKDTLPGVREGAHLCITEQFGKDIILDQFRQMAEAGLDYIQFFDQNYGGMNYPCYAQDHHHPALPGAWLTESMQQLLKTMTAIGVNNNPELRIGAESSAPLPYLAHLPFSDARSLHNLRYGRPVPGYDFVFHRYSNNFMGNQCAMWDLIDCNRSPDNLLWRIAEGFCAGQLLSVTLRADGSISWGAADNWSCPGPDSNHVKTLIRNLNGLRKKYPEFLAYGDMQKSDLQIETGEYLLVMRDRAKVMRYPALTVSTWRAGDGRRCQFIVNFRAAPETAKITSAVPFHTGDGVEYSAGTHGFTIPELSALVILI